MTVTRGTTCPRPAVRHVDGVLGQDALNGVRIVRSDRRVDVAACIDLQRELLLGTATIEIHQRTKSPEPHSRHFLTPSGESCVTDLIQGRMIGLPVVGVCSLGGRAAPDTADE